ncbi:MAG: FecR family protein [Endomicrobiia bacterium]|nr:FecR family protein [Endomicrobiia bacterium]
MRLKKNNRKAEAAAVILPIFFFALALSPTTLIAEQGIVTKVAGNVQVYSPHSDMWYEAGENLTLKGGQKIRTAGGRSKANVRLEEGSRVEVGPNSSVSFENLKKESPTIKVFGGKLKAWVSKFRRNKFEVHTPVAVCSVRGTEFEVIVDDKGDTEIDVIEGLVGVAKSDDPAREIALGAGERLEVRQDAPLSPDDKTESQSDEKIVRSEVGLGMSKEQVQAAAASEMRMAEYMEGKTLVDAFGKRVRLEEYIMRPAADEFKIVVLNERADRFDYFYYKGKFNKDLPADMSVALADIGGKAAVAPDYYLTGYETGRSNTLDTVKEDASGGHIVDVNNNVDANNNTVTSDDVTNYFDPATDTFVNLASGEKYYKSIFDKYDYYINGTKKMWYSGANLQSEDLALWKYAGDTMQSKTEWPAGESALYQRISNFYGNGTWEKWDNYIISDEGQIAPTSAFNGITSGKAYKEELLRWNYQQVVTASEFGGRKIDLVVEPKIMIKSGLIK